MIKPKLLSIPMSIWLLIAFTRKLKHTLQGGAFQKRSHPGGRMSEAARNNQPTFSMKTFAPLFFFGVTSLAQPNWLPHYYCGGAGIYLEGKTQVVPHRHLISCLFSNYLNRNLAFSTKLKRTLSWNAFDKDRSNSQTQRDIRAIITLIKQR